MIGSRKLRRLEHWMGFVRCFSVAFGALAVSIEPYYPNQAAERAGWTMVALLAVGSIAIWGAAGRFDTERHFQILGAAAWAFDTFVILGFLWVFAFELPYVTWALLLLVPMEGALRYRVRGALGGALLVALAFIPQSIHRADLLDTGFDVPTYVFVVGLTVVVAGITGTMANSWHEQTLALESQSLRLSELDRLKDRFLAVTSHEIRGPLTAIIGAIDMVRQRADRLTPEQRDRLLTMVSQQSHGLARLVDDLMITTHLQAGHLALQPDWVELQPTINQALEAAASKRRAHQLEVFVDPVRCEIDAARIGQIVRNLVENAYKYTPDRARVRVAARPAGEGISIEVVDDGPGIPPEHRDKLFEAFSRAEATAAGQDGVGLGLYVVSELVAAMKGRIDLSSSTQGTVFTIWVPCKVEAIEGRRLDLVTDEGAAG
jgi:signal transduction histidine kinase